MNCKKLMQNIMDVIAEEQIKLGYRSEVIYLYYPLKSLNSLLGTDSDIYGMNISLAEFSEYAKEYLGKIGISNRKERFCIAIPTEGADYVHAHMGENDFLKSFIETVSKHGCTLEDIVGVFGQYSDKVTVQKIDDGEFDYVVYFTDGKPNAYRYCIKFEGNHASYHRFTEDDYINLNNEL